MKTKLFIYSFSFLLICIFSTTCFAQPAPGGGSECPTSYSFKSNNGKGLGVCNGDQQIRVNFSIMPSPENFPLLTALYYQGQLVTKVTLPVVGYLVTEGQGYVCYCLVRTSSKNNGNPFGKISPSIKMVLEFTYPDGTICRTDNVN